MTNLEKLLGLVEKHRIQFYLEHNDFQATDLPLDLELSEIKDQGLLTDIEVIACKAMESIWSARFYSGTDQMVLAYSYDAEECARKLLSNMDEEYE